MLQIIADTHTHSLAVDHAYSTVRENSVAAAEKGLQFLAVTEHGPALSGAPTRMHFSNLRTLPRRLSGVVLLKGAEVNILDYDGTLDLEDPLLEKLEWVIASMHIFTLQPGTAAEHTRAWMRIANNPLVDVIGHCGDGRYPFDHKSVIREFAATGKIVEINNHSFGGRPGSAENCREIALLCAEYGVPVVTSSDAHFFTQIGEFGASMKLLEEIGFPPELVLNADYDRFLEVARRTSGKMLTNEIE